MKSSHHNIDLTNLFFDSIEGIHRSLYHIEKQILQNNKERVVTRSEAEHYSKQYLYGFTTSLLQITLQKENSELLYPHITIDINRPRGREGLSALATAVSLRLYRLYHPLIEVGASLQDTLKQAIINNDHVSIALLLNTSNPSLFTISSSKTESDVPLEISLACSYPYINKKIVNQMYQTYLKIYSLENNKIINNICDHLKLNNNLENNLTSSSQINNIESSTIHHGGYQDLEFTYSNNDNNIPQCKIETINLNKNNNNNELNHDIEILLIKYIKEKRPFLIKGLINNEDLEKWSFSFLQKIGKKLKVTPQFIPYEDQLQSPNNNNNNNQNTSTLSNYLNEMRNYTLKLKEWKELNEKNNVHILSRFGGIKNQFPLPLPRYIFDNKILSSYDSVSSLLNTPFPSLTKNDISQPTISHSSKIYDQIIQLTSDILHNYTKKSLRITKQFYLGPTLSGAPFHAHGPAFNALIYGRKLWFLLPPGSDLYSNIPPLLWSSRMDSLSSNEQEKYYPYPLFSNADEINSIPSQLCQYTQNSGDTLFVPSLYTHQILNLAESIGFATEIHYEGMIE